MLADFVAYGSYPTATSDSETNFPAIESGFAFTKGTLNDLGNEVAVHTSSNCSATFTIKYYNPKFTVIQRTKLGKK